MDREEVSNSEQQNRCLRPRLSRGDSDAIANSMSESVVREATYNTDARRRLRSHQRVSAAAETAVSSTENCSPRTTRRSVETRRSTEQSPRLSTSRSVPLKAEYVKSIKSANVPKPTEDSDCGPFADDVTVTESEDENEDDFDVPQDDEDEKYKKFAAKRVRRDNSSYSTEGNDEESDDDDDEEEDDETDVDEDELRQELEDLNDDKFVDDEDDEDDDE